MTGLCLADALVNLLSTRRPVCLSYGQFSAYFSRSQLSAIDKFLDTFLTRSAVLECDIGIGGVTR